MVLHENFTMFNGVNLLIQIMTEELFVLKVNTFFKKLTHIDIFWVNP